MSSEFDVEYRGWDRFGDTAQDFRSWILNRDFPEWKAKAGDELLDRGPLMAKTKRFEIRRDHEVVATFGETKLRASYFKRGLPPWRPPREGETELRDALVKMTDALGLMAKAQLRQSEAERQLAEIRRVVKETEGSKAPAKAKENGLLRLLREDTYSNGEPYTDWELLVDVPEIRLTERFDVDGRPHAQKGDVLREEADDLTPFRLRRGGKRVASPEHWQVRHLFAGLRGTDSAEDPPTPRDSATGRIATDGRLLSRFCDLTRVRGERDEVGIVYYAERDVEGTPIRAGDFVRLRYWGDQKIEPEGGTRILPVPRAQLVDADRAIEDGALRPIVVNKYASWSTSDAEMVETCRAKLRRPQRKSWSDSSSPLLIVRPLVALVSAPIEATTDDGALFELLHQVGGRMPSA